MPATFRVSHLLNSVLGCAFAGALLLSLPAAADVPVSVGTDGALERASQTVTASRNASAASFGSTSDDDRRLFKLRWRIPFFQTGDQVDDPLAGFLPLPQYNTVHGFLPGLNSVEEGLTDLTSYIPQIEFGEEKKLFRFQAGVLSTSLGHGTLVKSYTNAPEGARRSFGMLLEGNLAGLGGQILVGNLLAPQSFTAARAYVRPLLAIFSPDAALQPNEFDLDPRTEALGIWVSGVTATIDMGAPTSYVNSEELGLWETPENPAIVWAVGWDNEAALLDNQVIKFIPYLDLNVMGGTQSGLFGSNVGTAGHLGAEMMFDFTGVRIDIDAEYNVASDGYAPRYFDRLYALERFSVFGRTDTAKAGLDVPASHGYRLRASAGLFEMFTVFAEAADQFPMDFGRGGNSATFTAGASGWVGFFGGNVVVSQSGVSQYTAPGVLGPGFVFLAEGRVAVPFVFNTVHFIGRFYRVHDPDPTTARGFNEVAGGLVGMEINLDFL